MRTLYWFTRDLRLHDNPALLAAARSDMLLCVFVVDPRWFTGDRLRYDLIDGQWVATDLRLGMSGYHPFRFALATVDPATGETALISEVEQWPQRRPDAAALRLMAERALDARTPLSIAELSRSLTEPAPHQQR